MYVLRLLKAQFGCMLNRYYKHKSALTRSRRLCVVDGMNAFEATLKEFRVEVSDKMKFQFEQNMFKFATQRSRGKLTLIFLKMKFYLIIKH